MLRVVDAAGNGLPGYFVSTSAVNDGCSLAMASLDIVNRDVSTSSFLAFALSPPSLASGDTAFNELGFLDAITGCYRIVFFVTDGKSTAMTLSDPLCVRNLDRMELNSNPSTAASPGATLEQGFSVSILRPYKSFAMDNLYMAGFTLLDTYKQGVRYPQQYLSQVLNVSQSFPSFLLSMQFLDNSVCIWAKGDVNPKVSVCACVCICVCT